MELGDTIMVLSLGAYKAIAASEHLDEDPVYPCPADTVGNYRWYGKVVPKQRPRAGKSGKFFTPKETRNFEREIKECFKDQGFVMATYPLVVNLLILDGTDKLHLLRDSKRGLTYYTRNDLDNCAKAVLDAANGVLWKDDRQIVRLSVGRSYHAEGGFALTWKRGGLSKSEYENYLRVREKTIV